MEAIGQLTGGVAHDFNNLLQVINAGVDLALDEPGMSQDARIALQEVVEAGERAARLVSQLLLFSRRQVMTPRLLDINEVVSELLKMLGRVLGEQIQVQWHPGTHMGAVFADRGMVEQAVMNLCVNARDAMPTGGTLTIATRTLRIEQESGAPHPGVEPGYYVLMTVTDTGCGMDAQTRERVFEPFFSTKERGKGTGLGLATVYGIAQQHGGQVGVSSAPGEGATFSIYWPARDAEAESEVVPVPAPIPGGTETILLAEDEESVRRMARAILERAGYTVLTAENGEEAVRLFAEQGAAVDLVILDVVMPVLGGRDACARMRAMRPSLKTLFASGYSTDAIHTNYVLDEGVTLIKKPFTRQSLLSTVREALDQPAPEKGAKLVRGTD